MESATVFVFSLLLLLSPTLSAPLSSLSAEFGHESRFLGQQDGGLEVELVHRHHVDYSEGGRKLSDGEYLADRIIFDKERQVRQKQQLQAALSQRFPHPLACRDQNAEPGEFVTPMVSGSGLGSGQYFIDFYLGTPPQKFSLIADTGSDAIWVQCTPCISCYQQTGPLFFPKDSSTYNELACNSTECQLIPGPANATCATESKTPGVCDYEYRYADGSSTIGIFATETATMNFSKAGQTTKLPNLAFGCGMQNTGPSFRAAGGVIGLGQGPVSFPSQIGSYFGNQFSYCLVSFLDAPTISSTLVFGNAGPTKSTQKAQSTPFIKNQYLPSVYYVGIQHVSVGGSWLPVPPQLWEIDFHGNGGSIVDSGTTLTVFLEPAYQIILNSFVDQVTHFYPRVPGVQGLDFCFNTSSGSDDKISHLPWLSVTFNSGAVFYPPNENIYVPVTANTYCLAMAGSAGPYGYNVLGNLVQQNFEITYDLQSQIFSFAPAQCRTAK